MPSKYETFRALHQPGNPFIIPNPWDRGSAQILASMGFKALATTSAGFGFTRALKDGDVGRDMMIDHCADLVSSVDLPISGDLENCYAQTTNDIHETIRLAIETGLAGCSIEDMTGNPDAPLYSFEEAVERTSAAVEACRSIAPEFVLTARAENFLYGNPDLDDTIKRLVAFETAGADVLYAPGLSTLEQVREVCTALTKPVNVLIFARDNTFTTANLAEAGAARISLGSTLSRAIFGTFMRASEEMLQTGTFSFVHDAASFRAIETHFKSTE